MRRLKHVTLLGFVAGLVLLAYIISHFGVTAIVTGVRAAGWGVLWVALYRGVILFVHGAGWRALFPGESAPSVWLWFRARWICEAINSLLPVGQVGGDVARAQMVARRSSSGTIAAATVAVDLTLGLVAQLAFTVAGGVLLAGALKEDRHQNAFLAGLLLAACALAGLWLVQRSNLLGKIAGKLAEGRSERWVQLASSVADWSRETAAIFADHVRVSLCFVGRLVAWLLHTGETWLILYFLGHATSWQNALVLESLSNAVRSASFALPGALGTQEASLVLLGPMVGISPETALALAVMKRIRELLVGVPGLWAWAATEGKHLSSLLIRNKEE